MATMNAQVRRRLAIIIKLKWTSEAALYVLSTIGGPMNLATFSDGWIGQNAAISFQPF